jgi:hypothetical protein
MEHLERCRSRLWGGSRDELGRHTGKCTVPFRIMYEEIKTEQYSVDWCKVKNIYVTDDNVTYD